MTDQRLTPDDVRALLDATTRMYRPGPAVTDTVVAGIRVREVWVGTPHESEATIDPDLFPSVDVHFFMVSVDRAAAESHRGEFIAVCEAWPIDPTYEPENRLTEGPSFIELGAQIGTFMGQQDAMRLMALGQVLGAWTVISPATFGLSREDPQAQQMAGAGYVMVSGYKRPTDDDA